MSTVIWYPSRHTTQRMWSISTNKRVPLGDFLPAIYIHLYPFMVILYNIGDVWDGLWLDLPHGSHPQHDRKVKYHYFNGDLLFYLFGDFSAPENDMNKVWCFAVSGHTVALMISNHLIMSNLWELNKHFHIHSPSCNQPWPWLMCTVCGHKPAFF